MKQQAREQLVKLIKNEECKQAILLFIQMLLIEQVDCPPGFSECPKECLKHLDGTDMCLWCWSLYLGKRLKI